MSAHVCGQWQRYAGRGEGGGGGREEKGLAAATAVASAVAKGTGTLLLSPRRWLQGNRRLGVSRKFSQDEPVGDIDWRATRRAVGPSIGRFSVG